MPSNWETFGESLGLSSRRSSRTHKYVPSDSLHYADKEELVVCRCRAPDHSGNKRVGDEDLLYKSTKHFDKHPEQYQCARKGYWEARSKSSAAQRLLRDTRSTNTRSARGYSANGDDVMIAFGTVIQNGPPTLEAFQDTTDSMYCLYGRRPSPADMMASFHDPTPFYIPDLGSFIEFMDNADPFGLTGDMRSILPSRRQHSAPTSGPHERSRTNHSSSVRLEQSRRHRPSQSDHRDYTRDSSAYTHRAKLTYGREPSLQVAATTRSRHDDMRRAQLHNQRWNPNVGDHLQRRHEATARRDDPTSNPVPASAAQQTTQSRSTMRPESNQASSNCGVIDRDSILADDESNEARTICLQIIRDVFPDIATDYLLALINAVVTTKTYARANAENIIGQLLAEDSYPKETDAPLIEVVGKTPMANDRRTHSCVSANRPPTGLRLHPAPTVALDWPPLKAVVRGSTIQADSNSMESAHQSVSGRTVAPVESFQSTATVSRPAGHACAPQDAFTTTTRARHQPAQDTKSSSVAVKNDMDSASSAFGDRRPLSHALDSSAYHWQDTWRDVLLEPKITDPNPSPQKPAPGGSFSIVSPLNRPTYALDLNDWVTTPTHNAWTESPVQTPLPCQTPHMGKTSQTSNSSKLKSTPLLDQLEAVRDSSMISPHANVTSHHGGSAASSDVFVRGSTLPDPFVSDQSAAAEAPKDGSTDSPEVEFSAPSRQPHHRDPVDDTIRTPMTRCQRYLLTARDDSARVAERRKMPKPFSPVNIEGGYEHIDALDATYGGDVSAASAGSPWAQNPRSLARPPKHEV